MALALVVSFSLLCVLEMERVNVTSVLVHRHVLERSVNAAGTRYDVTGV